MQQPNDSAQIARADSSVASCEQSDLSTIHDDVRALIETRIGTENWEKIARMEEFVEAQKEAFFELPTKHLFPPGLYFREVFMKKGDIIFTRVHMIEHVAIVSTGVGLVWSDEAGWKKISAPCSFITKPGTRRVIYIISDMIWGTVHPNPTNEKDPEKIVDEVTYDHYKLRIKRSDIQ